MLKQFSIAVAGAALVTFGISEAVNAASFQSQVIASDLDSPRGLTFGPDDSLYVTEAGRGGSGACIPSMSVMGAQTCYGATSAVTRIQNGMTERVVTGLPSLALNGTDAIGAHDIAFDANGEAYVVMGLGGSASDRNNNLIPAHDNAQFFGNLLAIDALDGGSSWTALADLAAYEAANNPDNGITPGGNPELISNPYAFSIQNDTAFVVDAGANDLLEVTLGMDESDSDIALKSVFPPRLVPNPTPQGPDPFPMQSVPTSIATDADGTFFVGELTGFPFPQDEARIYRLDANDRPQVYADGFTNIIDFAFDRDRNLYVLEYATNSLLSGDLTGALIRVTPDGTRTTIASEELSSPTALALDSNGDVYVSNRGFVAGEGEVLRISAVPEPASVLGLLAFGAGGTVWQLWRKRQLG